MNVVYKLESRLELRELDTYGGYRAFSKFLKSSDRTSSGKTIGFSEFTPGHLSLSFSEDRGERLKVSTNVGDSLKNM